MSRILVLIRSRENCPSGLLIREERQEEKPGMRSRLNIFAWTAPGHLSRFQHTGLTVSSCVGTSTHVKERRMAKPVEKEACDVNFSV